MILNLAIDPAAHKHVTSATDVLLGIVGACCAGDKSEVAKLQCIKARIALTIVVSGRSIIGAGRPVDHSMLRLRQSEAEDWVELLANLSHCRNKEGPGGYMSTTFSLKHVLFSL